MSPTTITTASPSLLFRRHVRRPRLTRLLDASTAQVILLSAPAGFGKTVLAEEWFLDGEQAAVWYRATPSSADVATFSLGLASAAKALVPRADERLQQRVRVAQPPEEAARPFAEILAEDLAEWPANTWLVIDDYHLVIQSKPVEQFMGLLLDLAPIRVLLTSRARPSWATPRRLLHGEITEIGQSELAMTDLEVAAVLSNHSDETVKAVVAQAGGWPVLIGLAALTASASIPRERVADELFQYLADEVLRQEPPEVQEFMLVTSVLGAIDAETAAALGELPDTATKLRYLFNRGLVHRCGERYRYHPLLHEFLSRTLKSERPQLFSQISEQAVEQARRAGDWEDAFEIAVRADSLDLAAEIIGQGAVPLMDIGKTETVEAWLETCRPQLESLPAARMAEATVFLRRGRFQEAASLAEAIGSDERHPPELRGCAWHIAGKAQYLQTDSEAALTSYQQALKLSSDGDDHLEALWGAFLVKNEFALDRGEDIFRTIERTAPRNDRWRLRQVVGHHYCAMSQGSLAGMKERFRVLERLAEQSGDPMVTSLYLNTYANLEIAGARYAEGRVRSLQSIRYCTEFRLDFAHTHCLLTQALAESGLRTTKACRETLDAIESLVPKGSNIFVDLMRDIINLRLTLGESHILSSLDQSFLQLATKIPMTLGEYLGLMAMSYAAEKKIDLMREYSRRSRSLIGIESMHYSRFAELIADLIEHPDDDELSTLACEIVESTIEAEFSDAIVMAYRSYPKLLSVLARDDKLRPRLLSLIANANDHELAARIGVGTHTSPLNALTPRELEVLRLLREGHTNPDIAATLVISLSTVKVHVRHIHRKLGVKTRLQAARRADTLLG